MKIRPLRRADAWQIKRFECASRRDPDYQRRIQYLVRRELLGAANDPDRSVAVMVAEEQGQLVGVLAEEANENGHGILLVAVRSDSRRQGVASALICQSILSWPEPTKETIVFVVHEDNAAMRSLLGNGAVVIDHDESEPSYEILAASAAELLQVLRGPELSRPDTPTREDFGLIS